TTARSVRSMPIRNAPQPQRAALGGFSASQVGQRLTRLAATRSGAPGGRCERDAALGAGLLDAIEVAALRNADEPQALAFGDDLEASRHFDAAIEVRCVALAPQRRERDEALVVRAAPRLRAREALDIRIADERIDALEQARMTALQLLQAIAAVAQDVE